MKLDLVHDIQTAYRKVVDAMSRPGQLADLTDEAGKADRDTGCYSSTLVIARMLLDTEVSFKVLSADEERVTNVFNQLTYAKAVTAEQADYIFVLHNATPEQLLRAFESAKIGELTDPHHSATIIVETASLSEGDVLTLAGPGIRHSATAKMTASMDWVDVREEKNAEFPLGIDLIFVDNDHRLLGLPRTTKVSKEVG